MQHGFVVVGLSVSLAAGAMSLDMRCTQFSCERDATVHVDALKSRREHLPCANSNARKFKSLGGNNFPTLSRKKDDDEEEEKNEINAQPVQLLAVRERLIFSHKMMMSSGHSTRVLTLLVSVWRPINVSPQDCLKDSDTVQ